MSDGAEGFAAEGFAVESLGEGVRVVNPDGGSPVLLVCEHAGHAIPARYGDLGIGEDVLDSHVAWDPGAYAVAARLSAILDASLVVQGTSRLVYDCNRPPESPGAMPAVTEMGVIPGNEGLSDPDKAERVESVYRPFEAALAEACKAHHARRPDGAILTVHSFTPVFYGRPRSVEIGILHSADRRLADALLAVAGATSGHDVRRNAPYGPEDGVLHTLDTHAAPLGALHAMIEIRNDLVATEAAARAMAERLADWTFAALDMVRDAETRRARA